VLVINYGVSNQLLEQYAIHLCAVATRSDHKHFLKISRLKRLTKQQQLGFVVLWGGDGGQVSKVQFYALLTATFALCGYLL